MKNDRLDGVLVVHKPVGPSSHDVVVVARRSLGISRIGHTGTLDPQASGVLPLVLGQATRLAQHLTGSDKEYEATIRFGVISDTYDAAGDVVAGSGGTPTRQELEAVLPQFRGTLAQTPPVYSAKMVAGERSYVRARAGQPVAAAAVAVTVHALELLAFDAPAARVRVRCSAGFYVRSLAHELGRTLGHGAILERLVRTEAAGFRLDSALDFASLVQAPRAELRACVLPMEALLTDAPAITLTPEGADWVRHGRQVSAAQGVGPLPDAARLVRLLGPDGRLIGLGKPAAIAGFVQPYVVFSYN